MRRSMFARLIGCFAGFSLAGAVLPGARPDGWAAYLMAAAVMTPLYFLARLITRPIALAFDLLLFGLPCLFLEALVIWGYAALLPGIAAGGYWYAVATLLLGVGGAWLAGKAMPDFVEKNA